LLSPEQLHNNKLSILQQNALAENGAALCEEPQICIEMETGTGKTLVYIRTLSALQLHKIHYTGAVDSSKR